MAHTPGPISIMRDAVGGDFGLVHGGIIGEAFRRVDDDTYADAEANARLWAAGDEMLGALRLARAALDHLVPEQCWATGPMTGDPIEDLIVCPGCRAVKAIDAAIAKATGQE